MSELFQAGLMVTLMGMGVVFVLLTILVGVVQAMSRIIGLIEGDSAPTAGAPPVGAATVSAPQARSVEREIVSAAAAAIQMYRNRRKS